MLTSQFFIVIGEALRRIEEGAVMIRTKGEAGTGNVVEAVRHMKRLNVLLLTCNFTIYEYSLLLLTTNNWFIFIYIINFK
jgi:hypothetical protein